jgi:hypothetical protein
MTRWRTCKKYSFEDTYCTQTAIFSSTIPDEIILSSEHTQHMCMCMHACPCTRARKHTHTHTQNNVIFIFFMVYLLAL